jgi:CheY-like chemotaxis protein
MGHEVHSAGNGNDAVAIAMKDAPHLVLLDLGLPDIDGYQVAQAIRQRYASDRMAIIALTGWGSARDMERTRAAGFDRHLTKPVEPARLAQAVHEALQRIT